MAHMKPMNSSPVKMLKGGHTLRFSEAFLLRKKKPAESNPSMAQTPKKMGKSLSGFPIGTVISYEGRRRP